MKPRHFIPVMVLALLIAYPLSIGPVNWWFLEHGDRVPVPDWVRVLYAPLRAANNNSQTVQRVLDWYNGIWMGRRD